MGKAWLPVPGTGVCAFLPGLASQRTRACTPCACLCGHGYFPEEMEELRSRCAQEINVRQLPV
jgi:hypothetical protein